MKIKAIALVLVFLVAPTVRASVSSIGFDLIAPNTASASPTGDINSATSFTLMNMGSTANVSGVFTGLPIQDFGVVSFSPGTGTSLIIRSPQFGFFISKSFTTIANFEGFLNLLVDGTFRSGTLDTGIKTAPAEVRLGLTQTPPVDGQISFSGTLSTAPVTVVPELPTALLFFSGIGIILAGTRMRKVLI